MECFRSPSYCSQLLSESRGMSRKVELNWLRRNLIVILVVTLQFLVYLFVQFQLNELLGCEENGNHFCVNNGYWFTWKLCFNHAIDLQYNICTLYSVNSKYCVHMPHSNQYSRYGVWKYISMHEIYLYNSRCSTLFEGLAPWPTVQTSQFFHPEKVKLHDHHQNIISSLKWFNVKSQRRLIRTMHTHSWR